MSREHIHIVEDDPAILAGLQAKLELEGFQVTSHTDGERARRHLEHATPDLIVLDLMLPGLDGLSLLRWLRRRNARIPVLILSARGAEEQKVDGLRAGADDYLAKPFGLDELMARIEALLRRARGGLRSVRFGSITIDLDTSRVTRAGQDVPLSPKELDLLLFLVRRHDQIIARDTILSSVWGDLTISDPRAVDYHILNLRKKLEEDPKNPRHLLTRHGLGYELRTEAGGAAEGEA